MKGLTKMFVFMLTLTLVFCAIVPTVSAVGKCVRDGGEGIGMGKGRGSEMRRETRGDRWEKAHEKRVERLSETLSLSAEQKEKLSAILEGGRKELKTEREEMMKRAQFRREATDKKIEEILTEEQKVKFREHREEMRRKVSEKKGADADKAKPDNGSKKSVVPPQK